MGLGEELCPRFSTKSVLLFSALPLRVQKAAVKNPTCTTSSFVDAIGWEETTQAGKGVREASPVPTQLHSWYEANPSKVSVFQLLGTKPSYFQASKEMYITENLPH